LNSHLCDCQYHIVFTFCHAPTTIVNLMFVWGVHHFQKLKQMIHAFKISHGPPKGKKLEISDKL
jgi:hypothetical protein